MASRATTQTNGTPRLADIEWADFPPNGAPAEGAGIIGKFKRLVRSTQGFSFPGGQGEVFPLIVIYEAVEGTTSVISTGETMDVEPGREYSLWLIHSILEESFRSARPTADELFAVWYRGKTEAKKAKGRDGEAVTFHNYSVAWPNREKVDTSLDWDAV